MKHSLKIEVIHLANILLGRKKFEVRYNDRGYQLGDTIKFESIDGCTNYGGEYEIIYVHSGYGLEKDFVVLGIEKRPPHE